MHEDKNDMAYWFPKLAATGVPVPRTELITAGVDLSLLLDGITPSGFEGFMLDIHAAACRIPGPPWFLRTGHTSGKHRWAETCRVERLSRSSAHVAALTEASALADIIGLPTNTWAVREFLDLRASFTAFHGMPVAREFRIFVKDGPVQCIHFYWPEDSIRNPTISDWKSELRVMESLGHEEWEALSTLACRVSDAFDGAWAVDFAMLDRASDSGAWVAIDMAEAARAFHDPRCPLSPLKK
jgi:hypothetical protein